MNKIINGNKKDCNKADRRANSLMDAKDRRNYKSKDEKKKDKMIGSLGEVLFEREFNVNHSDTPLDNPQGDYEIKGNTIELKCENWGNRGHKHLYPTYIFKNDKTGANYGGKSINMQIIFAWVNIGQIKMDIDHTIMRDDIYEKGHLCIKKSKIPKLKSLYYNGKLRERNKEAYGFLEDRGFNDVEKIKWLRKSAWRVTDAKDYDTIKTKSDLKLSKQRTIL